MPKPNPNKAAVEIPADLIEERVISVQVAAQIADLSEWTMYDIIKRGNGPPTVHLCGRKIGIRKRSESLDRVAADASRRGGVMTRQAPAAAHGDAIASRGRLRFHEEKVDALRRWAAELHRIVNA